jgi:hypothetical protein
LTSRKKQHKSPSCSTEYNQSVAKSEKEILKKKLNSCLHEHTIRLKAAGKTEMQASTQMPLSIPLINIRRGCTVQEQTWKLQITAK